ncbi:cytochrome P450 [Pluteus cervinus]|uniref:Cytochrome P450 n=1 Tax=Pluteus cervinus TaxID=181527 RepID=A0ACD3AJB0_9AGAR|nr:cytochrome P450 [Pluteus cervinus]
MITNHIHQLGTLEVAYYVTLAALALKVLPFFWRRFFSSEKKLPPPPLQGPASESWLFGLHQYISNSPDVGAMHEQWAEEYGPAFIIPGLFGSKKVMIRDPKAVAHFYSKETYGYVQTRLAKVFIETLFGRGLLWAEGDSHKRQRKALSPAFSNAAIRRLTSVFYDSAYKTKEAWDARLEAESDTVIDVQAWMNHIALDSIGIAGFGHDFGSLNGTQSAVSNAFNSLGSEDVSYLSNIVVLLSPAFPALLKLPTSRNEMIRNLKKSLSDIADELLKRTRQEKGGEVGAETAQEKSIIGMLIKAENNGVSQEEIVAQMNVLLLAGYETTSISLTWALIELSRQPEKQERLRNELASFRADDPSWDDLMNGLPYLDAVTHEILRLHPPVGETTRVAAEDDILPFAKPVTLSSGETVSSLVIPKGTVVGVPIRAMNRSEAFWGEDAKTFVPERWLDEDKMGGAKDISGHKHILTFSDGPRICLGRAIALTEFKSVLSVLIRNYRFELPEGPKTIIERHRSILPRPKVAGQQGALVPLRIQRVE